ncbi:hypothetical protein Gpo141_00004752 [Globisporangium polare]
MEQQPSSSSSSAPSHGAVHVDASAVDVAVPRPDQDVPVWQLTRQLIHTYNKINQNYYAKRKLAQDGLPPRKKKSAGGLKKGEKSSDDYQFLPEEEVFNGRYKVVGKKLGTGSFGQVVEAQDMQTGQEVAIKIVKKKKNFTTQAQLEIGILESLHRPDHGGKKYIVQLKDSFVHKGHQCLVFERLDSNLFELLKKTNFKGVSLKLVRKLTKQILMALDYLSHPSVNVIHCDLKPENILLVHSSRSQLKIIDFGSSCLSQSQLYQYIQSRFYRSPEVLLGMQYTTAIDMWSLACIMVEMHTGKPLFGGSDQHDQLRRIANVLGMPPRELIDHANPTYRRDFFDEMAVGEGENRVVEYRLKLRKSSSSKLSGHETDSPTTLAAVIGADSGGPGGLRLNREEHSPEDYRLFLDLLHRMLDYNPATRITPAEALLHPFMASNRQSTDTKGKKKAKSMRSNQMQDVHDSDSSFYDPADSKRHKLRRLYETPGIGH